LVVRDVFPQCLIKRTAGKGVMCSLSFAKLSTS